VDGLYKQLFGDNNNKISGMIYCIYSSQGFAFLCINDKKATDVLEGANMDLTLSVSPCI